MMGNVFGHADVRQRRFGLEVSAGQTYDHAQRDYRRSHAFFSYVLAYELESGLYYPAVLRLHYRLVAQQYEYRLQYDYG